MCTNCLEGTPLLQCTRPLSPACLTSSQAKAPCNSTCFHLIYFPLSYILASCPMSVSASSHRGKHSSSQRGFCSCTTSGNTKRQCSAPGQLEVRTLRDRAAGTSLFCISILHLPHHTASTAGFLPRSHSHALNITSIYSLHMCPSDSALPSSLHQGLRTLS